MRYDIEIFGRGFYSIVPHSRRGRNFMALVEGFDGRAAFSDSLPLTQNIADAAFYQLLNVSVNGQPYRMRLSRPRFCCGA